MISAISLMLLLSAVSSSTALPVTPEPIIAVFEDAELKAARQAYDAGDLQQAVAILTAYVGKKPKSFDGYFQLGLSYRGLKQYGEAVAALEKAIQLKSKSTLAQFELGQTYLIVKNYEGAARQYRWLQKKDNRLADEFRLYIPTEVAKQYQLLPSMLEQQQADIEAAQPILPMTADLKPTILYRERAIYTEEARSQKISGTIVLGVVYSKQGKLIVFSVIRGLPNGLTVSAIEAARKIRFNPPMKDGQPVSVRGTVEYSFSLY